MRFYEGILGNSHWLWNERAGNAMWGLALLKEEAWGPGRAKERTGSGGHHLSPAEASPSRDFAILWVTNLPFLPQPLQVGNFATCSPLLPQCLYSCSLSLPLFTCFLILKALHAYFWQFRKHEIKKKATFPRPRRSRVAEPWFLLRLADVQGYFPNPTTYFRPLTGF